ncbi:hypothetical protein CRE_04821 [Caenorhabditis remanei]|uniref:Uncharacterized protein n=1 Tax=Caenorhabditis remanei TaxID=31234 RepID=E3LZE7_CAERE|nr:hypothetical protein CRE_04821 [Caenorhabditis remanei]
MAPINGFHEDNDEAIRLRDSFRDEVSKRMGELLLKGQTMLDEYCPTCSGILMEDRTGVRRCVTCELFREKTSHIVAEIPLQEEDLQEAVDQSQARETASAEKTPATRKAIVPKAAPVVKKSKKIAENTHGNDYTDTIVSAKSAVMRKLEWATSQLDSTEDTSRVFDFLTVIQKSAETLQALQL